MRPSRRSSSWSRPWAWASPRRATHSAAVANRTRCAGWPAWMRGRWRGGSCRCRPGQRQTATSSPGVAVRGAGDGAGASVVRTAAAGVGVQAVGRCVAVGGRVAGRVAGHDPSRRDRRAERIDAGGVGVGVFGGGRAPTSGARGRLGVDAAVPERRPNKQIGSTNPARANERGGEPFAKAQDSRAHPAASGFAGGSLDSGAAMVVAARHRPGGGAVVAGPNDRRRCRRGEVIDGDHDC